MKYPVNFRSPHKTCQGLTWPKKPIKVLVRWGAGKKVRNTARPLRCPVEINSLPAILQNADKIYMKQIFAENNISSPEFALNTAEGRKLFIDNKWNVVFKRRFHSGGNGMEFEPIENIAKFEAEIYHNGILERRINTKREFRIHVIVPTGKWMAVEKLRRKDRLNERARNLENCIFKLDFPRPDNWQEAVDLAFKAAAVMNLDVSAVDIAWSGKKWYVIETNSAAGMADKTKEFYQKAIDEAIDVKIEKYLKNE